jgi:HTH-type transcriptional regulator, sugar sensing transcriptional regulator
MTLKIIENLQKLGFTENEAKIYAVLVCLKQARASEIAEDARVPRPKVYKTLRNMEKKGYVKIIEGEPTLFCCVDPEELIFRIRKDFMLSLNEAASELNSLNPVNCGYSSRNIHKLKVRA